MPLSRRFLLFLLACTATVALAIQETITLKDRAGNLTITNFGEFGSVIDASVIRFTMKGKTGAGPIRAEWSENRLTVLTGEMSGIASRNADRTLSLVSADMSRSVRATMTAPSAGSAGTAQTSILVADSADYTAQDSRMNLRGGVSVVNEDPGVGQRIAVQGRSAVVTVLPLGQAPAPGQLLVKTADVAGPSTIELTTRQADGTSTRIHATADRVVFNDSDRTIKLMGNVTITGNDPALIGDVKGITSATITLSPDRKPKGISMQGNPATTTIRGGGQP